MMYNVVLVLSLHFKISYPHQKGKRGGKKEREKERSLVSFYFSISFPSTLTSFRETGETVCFDPKIKIKVPDERNGLYAIDTLDPDMVYSQSYFYTKFCFRKFLVLNLFAIGMGLLTGKPNLCLLFFTCMCKLTHVHYKLAVSLYVITHNGLSVDKYMFCKFKYSINIYACMSCAYKPIPTLKFMHMLYCVNLFGISARA